jgi:hypothetical protein
MNRCPCQSPPLRADGGSGRSGSPAARLPRPGMPDGVLDLYTLRSRTTLLQPSVPHRSPAPTAPGGQPSLSAESGGPTRPPGCPLGPAAAVPRAPVPAARDGSIFPFGHFSGTIRLWRNDHDAVSRGAPVALRVQSLDRLEKRTGIWLRCSICGRPGRFVDPFPHIPRRR